MYFFSSEIFKRLPTWNPCFRNFLRFLYFLKWWCFEIAPARGSPVIVTDLVMTSQIYIKVEHVRTWLLVLVLQSFNSFDLKDFFVVLFSLNFAVYKGDIQLTALGSWSPTGVFQKVNKNVSVLFYRLKSSNCFPIKTHVYGMSFVFCTFFYNDGALNSHLHVVALPASATMSWPAKTT